MGGTNKMKYKNILIIFLMFVMLSSFAVAESPYLASHYELQQNGNNELTYNGYSYTLACASVLWETDVPSILTGLTYSADFPRYRYCTDSLIQDELDKHPLNNANDFSISLWYNDDAVTPSGYYTFRIVGLQDGTNNKASYLYWGPNFLGFTVYDSALHYDVSIDHSEFTVDTWYSVTATYDVDTNTPKIYLNGVEHTGTAFESYNSDRYVTNSVWVGEGSSTSDQANINSQIVDVKFYNATLTGDDALDIYTYGEVQDAPTHNYSISIIQDPDNITTITIGNLYINASITDSIGNISTNSTANINFSVISKGNNNCTYIFAYNNSCVNIENNIYNMTKINDSYFSFVRDESFFFPTYYPFDEEFIENSIKTDYDLYGSNVFKFEIHNLTTDSANSVYVGYNIDYYSTVKEQPLFVMFCYHNYTSGVPITSDKCFEVDRLPIGTDFNHCHTTNSCHHISKIPPDFIHGNNNSDAFIIFGSTASTNLEKWVARYSLNSSYSPGTTVFQLSDDQGVSWTNTSYLFDAHIHQFANDDGINYTVTFTDNGVSGTINYTYDNFDILNSPPSHPVIYSPVSVVFTLNSTSHDIFFNWSESIDPDNDSIVYYVGLNDGVSDSNLTTGLTVTNYTQGFTSSDLTTGNYTTYVGVSDVLGNTVHVHATDSFRVCVNDWTLTTGLCIDGVQNMTYTDSNSCPDEYEQPDSYLQNCTITDETQTALINLIMIFILVVGLTIMAYSFKLGMLHIINMIIVILFLLMYYVPDVYETDNAIHFIIIIFFIMMAIANFLLLIRSK